MTIFLRTEGEAMERWAVTILIDRDPETEAPPDVWNWDGILGGGHPVIIRATNVGIVTGSPEEQRAQCQDLLAHEQSRHRGQTTVSPG